MEDKHATTALNQATNRPIRTNRSGKPIISRKDMKNTVFRKKRRSAVLGRQKIKYQVVEKNPAR